MPSIVGTWLGYEVRYARGRWDAASKIAVRKRLSAGGKWIRTIGTRKISYRFEADFCRLHDASRSRKGFTSFATGDRQFESISLQRRVHCEPDRATGREISRLR
jgi:hypothetical protein